MTLMRLYKALLLTGLLFLCAFQRLAAEQTPEERNENFKVGVILPLTGPLSEMGESFKRGMDLYQADQPNNTVSFVFEDHSYDGTSTVTALHALRHNEGVHLTIVWGNAPSGAAAPVAEQQKIPLLAVSMNPDARDRKFVVSLGPPVDNVVQTIVTALNDASVRKLAAVSIDMGNALEAIDKVGKTRDGGVLKKVVSNEEVDFKPIIAQLKSRGADGVILFLLPQQALTFLKQAKQMDYAPLIVGGDVFAVESFAESASRLTRNASFVYGAVSSSFIERLKRSKSGASYFFEVATGYTLAAVCSALALDWHQVDRGEDILGKLATTRVRDLPLSSIQFKDNKSFGRHFEVGVSAYPLALFSGATSRQ